jgi:hypothetical protein
MSGWDLQGKTAIFPGKLLRAEIQKFHPNILNFSATSYVLTNNPICTELQAGKKLMPAKVAYGE